MSFLNIMCCYYFSLDAVLQGMAKHNPTEKQIDVGTQTTLKHGQYEKTQKRVKFIVTNCKDRFIL